MVLRANSLPEFFRIAHYFAPLAAGEAGAFGLENDAAALSAPAGKQLVLTSDSCIEGWHVPMASAPQHLASKLVRRNLSDLAAMGATPWRYMLNLHLPTHTPDDYVAAFAAALAVEQAHFGMVLVGGDSTFGGERVHASLTAVGLATRTHIRSGAQVGDHIYVSGVIGEGALALMMVEGKLMLHGPDAGEIWQRYYAPEPRLALGQALDGIATSVIDISDGLLHDLAQIARASHVSMQVHDAAVPLHDMARRMRAQHGERMINGGDDYELAFTAPAHAAPMLQQLAQQLHLPLTPIGVVEEAQELAVILA